jgi:hypothetical protein
MGTAEPPKVDPPKRKRRWFQFSLRTLMIGVALLAVPMGYVGRQAEIVRQRRAVLNALPRWIPTNETTGLPWIRRLLGDEKVFWIALPKTASKPERQRMKALFPEALVLAFFETIHDSSGRNSQWEFRYFPDESPERSGI